MIKGKKIILKNFIKSLPICFILIFAANYFRSNSTLFMPKEYKTIKILMDKIASKNYLGDREIPFFIGSGRFMQVRAKELGLCEEEDCWYFNNLSPYKKHKNVKGVNINELVKQSYLFNGIEAYAWKGIVWLSQSTFRTYGEGNNFLNCTIGHELSHIIFDDYIDQNIKLSDKLKDFKKVKNKKLIIETIEEEKKLLEFELSRESEKKADNNGAKIVINAGYPKETCIEELTFLAQSSGLAADTENDSTHPGFIERIDSLKKFVDGYKFVKVENSKEIKPYKWKWSYDHKLKLLKFKPLN